MCTRARTRELETLHSCKSKLLMLRAWEHVSVAGALEIMMSFESFHLCKLNPVTSVPRAMGMLLRRKC